MIGALFYAMRSGLSLYSLAVFTKIIYNILSLRYVRQRGNERKKE